MKANQNKKPAKIIQKSLILQKMLNYFNFYCINNNIFAAENHQFNLIKTVQTEKLCKRSRQNIK